MSANTTTQPSLESSANQDFKNILHQLFDAPISLRKTRQSPREIISSYVRREVLIDSPKLHEYKGIPFSLRSGDPHRPYYPGEILSADKSTFRFRLTEDPNKNIENISYSSLRGIIILVREEGKITALRVYT